MTGFFLVLGVAAGALLAYRQGLPAVVEALFGAGELMLVVLPLVVIAVLMAAYAQALIPRDLAERWLGRGAGLKGIGLATLAGAVTPGGPFMAFPLVLGLRGVGASLPICTTYLTAWSVLGIQRVLIWELPFFGLDFVVLRLLVSLPLPLIAGLLTQWLTEPDGV
ncbi:hypothetical protein SPISAL_05275 [Spiribacter salinus M19-40]|jgi:uncharacterized membrane protein YraQ (UPF0718 family)|uniref:Permease n=1 Tax=Spiribacter salinus M19-40 TaxID=1260251 RepID=R4V5E0_9GAMM|nr:permease [Spiribacter salinus]AGM41149.1 hypothetical protein SPISAL_05275 [Spiribacter salinus M19-40]MBY5268388.1 hypothetical protein [Spiribacter salinus]